MIRFVLLNVIALSLININTQVYAGDVSIDKRMVWCQMVGWHSWNAVNKAYKNYHDVPLARPSGNPIGDYRSEVQSILDAGIDGITFEIIGGNEYGFQCEQFLKAAQGTSLQVANTLCKFHKDPNVQADRLAKAVKRFSKFSNYARCNGKPIFFTYGARTKTPQYWINLRRALKDNHGLEIFLCGDPDSLWNKATSVDDLNKYTGAFDIYYNYAEYGLVNRQQPQKLFAITRDAAQTGTLTGKWGAAIAPGYNGSWPLNGRNNFYIPFRGMDRFWDAWESAVKNDAPWVHLANWNDLDETPLQPMLFQFHTYSELNNYWATKWRGEKQQVNEPRVYFAYQREQLLGTTQRISMICLPGSGDETVVISGKLLDMCGNTVCNLSNKTISAGSIGQEHWLVDTSEFGMTPVLQPVFTLHSGGYQLTRKLPVFRLRTGWIQNQVVIKVPLHELADGQANLDITRTENDILDVQVEVDSPNSVRYATLWRDDRPVGSLMQNAENQTTWGIHFKWIKDHNIKIELIDGKFSRSFEHGPNSSGFTCDAISMAGRVNRYDYMGANVLGTEKTILKVAINNGKYQEVAIAQLKDAKATLRAKDSQPVAELSLGRYDPLAALPLPLKIRKGKLEGHFTCVTHSPSAMYYVRFETLDGKIFYSNAVTPFSESKQNIYTTILNTSVTLDKWKDLKAYQNTSHPERVRVHPALVQNSEWDFAQQGTRLNDLYSNTRMHLGSASIYYRHNPQRAPVKTVLKDGRTAFAFDGVDDVAELDIRQVPHGSFTIEVNLKPNRITGKPQNIFSSQHEANAPILMIDSDGHIVAGRQSFADGCDILVRSLKPIEPGEWTSVVVVFDETTTSLMINGDFAGRSSGITSRMYGNIRTYVGGLKNPFGGILSDLKIYSVSN